LQVMRSQWIVFESARKSFDHMSAHFGEWIATHVAFADWDDNSRIRDLWCALGVSDAYLDLIVDLQVRFADGKLLVAKSFEHNTALPQMLTTLYYKVWTFRRWNEARFLALSNNSRTLVASAILGLKSFVAFLIDVKLVSRYYIGGLSAHMTPKVMQMAVVSAVSSYANNAVCSKLMADDRIMYQLPDIDRCMLNGVRITENLHDDVYKALASVTSSSPGAVKNEAIAAAATSHVYLMERLRVYRTYPWSLAVGDIDANLDALAAGPIPADSIAAKIHTGLSIGMPKAIFVDGCKLLLQCAGTSMKAEHPHVVATMLMRSHKAYCTKTMGARALVTQAAPLMTVSPNELKLEACKATLEKLARKNPNYLTGRQVYVRELNQQAKFMRSTGRVVSTRIDKLIISKHGEGWRALNQQRREDYEARAKDAQDASRAAINARANDILAKGQAIQEDIDRLRSLDTPLQNTSCRLTVEEMRRMQEAYDSDKFSNRFVQSLVDSEPKQLGEISAPWQSALSEIQMPPCPQPRVRPAWTATLAWHRQFFQGCLFRFEIAGDFRYFQFGTAKQSPLRVGMIGIAPLPQRDRDPDRRGWTHDQLQSWKHFFRKDYTLVAYTDEWPLDVAAPLCVASGAFNVGNMCVASDADWKPLSYFADLLPPVSQANQPLDVDEKPRQDVHKQWFECPWLVDFIAHGKMAFSDEVLGGVPDAPPRDTSEGQFEVDAMQVMDALSVARDEWPLRDYIGSDHFAWNLLGGQWTASHRGIVYDCFESYARGGDPTDFCIQFVLQRSSSYAIDAHSEENAFQLAIAWCHKMQFLYHAYLASDAATVCAAEALSAYVEPAEIASIYLSAGRKTRDRIDQLRAIHPRIR
jgi:hypothetical protein